MKKIHKKHIVSFMVLCIVFLSLLYIPQIRTLLIQFGEKLKGRPLNHEIWNRLLIKRIALVQLLGIFTLLMLHYTALPVFLSKKTALFRISECVQLLKNKRFLFAFIVLFAFAAGIRLFWISQKKSMHIDEALTIAIANRNEYGFWGKPYERMRAYTGKELKDISLWDNRNISDAVIDVYHLHNNVNDSPHTNFYYSCIRLWFTGVKTHDINRIFVRGGLLNIFFLCFSYFFMYLLLLQFTKNTLSILLCLGIAFLNPAAVSLTLFLRPYELQQTMMIIFSFLFISAYKKIKESIPFETKKHFFTTSLLTALTMLSGYFCLPFIGLLGLIILTFAYKNKRVNTVNYYIYVFLTALVSAKVLYFGFGSGIFDYRGTEALSKLKLTNVTSFNALHFFSTLAQFIRVFHQENILLQLLLIIIIVRTIQLLLQNRQENNREKLLVIFVSSFWYLFTLYVAPYKIARYAVPVFPLFTVAFTFTAGKKQTLTAAMIAFICTFIPVVSFTSAAPLVKHLDDNHIGKIQCIKNAHIPIVIKGQIMYEFGSLIPYLNDEQQCYVIDHLADIKELPLKGGLFYLCNQTAEPIEEDIRGYTFKKKNTLIYYTEYLVEKEKHKGLRRKQQRL